MKHSPSLSIPNIFFFTQILLLDGLLLFSAKLVRSQQPDSCSSSLTQINLPFDPSSLHCVPVWSHQSFILRYAQTSPTVWSFVLSAPDANSYIAIGFSTNGNMVGSSAVVGWISTDGSSRVNQYYLGGQQSSQVVADQGSLDINSSSITSQSGRLFLAFQLNTDQPSSRLLYAVGPTAVFPSAPSYALSEHRDKVSTALNYASGQTQSENLYTSLRKSHGMLNMLGWGILTVIGAILARYFKQWDPIWFYSHTSIQSLGFSLGMAGVITGFVLEHRISADVSTHKGIGIFVLVLGFLQLMAFLVRPDKTSKVRKYWNWYHYSVGRILMTFAIANVFYGIHLGEEGNGWKAGYAVVIAILALVAVLLEIKKWMAMRK